MNNVKSTSTINTKMFPYTVLQGLPLAKRYHTKLVGYSSPTGIDISQSLVSDGKL